MKRKIYAKLVEWKNQEFHKPLILNGVRQCGKTYILKEFGREEFDNLAYSNIFCFIRVKLSAKILFLFRISNKSNSFLFLLLIINKFDAHCISHKKALYPSRNIGLYEIHLLKRIIYRSLTSHDSCRDSCSEAPRLCDFCFCFCILDVGFY